MLERLVYVSGILNGIKDKASDHQAQALTADSDCTITPGDGAAATVGAGHD